MKKILTLAAVASMALSASAANGNYADWGKLKLVNNQLSSQNGDPIQLKGWSTFSLHYGEVMGCLGSSQWALMQQYGANVVRLAMYIDESDSYISKPAKFKQQVKESIDEIAALNMYCIVDWHILETNGHSGDPNDYINESKDFFAEISKYCQDKGYNHVLYEICNEPISGWSSIKTYAESVIPVIVANQPDAIIIVGTDQWCQKIMEPSTDRIDSKFKNNVMYSFHYYACSHFAMLGDFRNAQKNIPVFVSEWSTVKFDGNGPFCKSNSDSFMSDCQKTEIAPQLVSWCIWNWGKKDEASSFFTGVCQAGNESKYTANDSDTKYGEYVLTLMGGTFKPDSIHWDPPTSVNKIPSTLSSAWHWDYYDLGGESIAYHDGNGTAWEKDEDGVIIDYKNGDEVDVFSLAKKMQWLSGECPWSTVEDGKVVSWDSIINTTWTDVNDKPTYKSLNGGRKYSGTDGSTRPDEGVDLSGASCLGTDYEYSGYCNLAWVEADEWINYTVKVEKPGYYKISGIIGAEYSAPSKTGEISIVSADGNHLRAASNPANNQLVTTFGFPQTTVCSDPTAKTTEPWNCWAQSVAKSGKNSTVLCAFPKKGEQALTIGFNADAGGVGPLIFEFYGDLDDEDPIKGADGVENVDSAVEFTIYPNPASGEFTITLAENVEATVEVVNMAGQVVTSKKIEGTATINKALAAGIYNVVVKSNGSLSTQKLIVQ